MFLDSSHRSCAPRLQFQENGCHAISRACIETLENRKLLSFAPAMSYPVGTNPQSVVTADFNGDGKLDLATANKGSNNVSVRLGNGAGGFGAVSQFATDPAPISVAVGDFDANGKLDVATARFDYGHLSALRGRGDGTFQEPVNSGAWNLPRALAAADFNADGRSDLVYSFADDMAHEHPAVAVALSDGEGRFGDAPGYYSYLNGSNSVALAVGDLNADGKVDVVTADDLSGTVSVLLGNGDGSLNYDWQYPRDFPAGQSPQAVAIGDFNGDGIPDLIVAGQSVVTLKGHGDGTFDAAISHLLSGSPHTAVATADFNDDGKLDAVVTDRGAATVSVMLGNGDGTMASFGAFAVGSAPAGVAVGDFNGDGRPDAAVANGNSNDVSVLLNDGGWGQPPPPAPPGIAVSDAPAITEGNTGTRNATFTVNLSKPAAVDVTVNYSTANVAGSAVAGSDYAAKTGTVTIPAGQTSASFAVAVLGDRTPEQTEMFAVNLSAATNGTIIDSQGFAMILDDEPRISINNASQAEGNSKTTTTMTFTVSLSAAYDQSVTVNYTTANGSATAGSDYLAKSGSVTFLPGQTSKTITVTVKGDRTRESNETFFVDLFGPSSNALISVARGVGTILDDDNLWQRLGQASADA